MTPARPGPGRDTPRALIPLVCIVLSLAILAVYWRTARYPFITFDDDVYVFRNPMVLRGVSSAGFVWAFSALHINWHPLTWLSHMLDVELFGLNAGRHHLVNVALHIANTALLFVALTRLTKKAYRSAIVAAIFALHPLHVESVAWIAERKDVLSTFFELLTLLCYEAWARTRRPSRYLAVLLFFACALMAKPMAVTFPFVLLLLDYWPLQRHPLRPLLREKLPLLAMSAAASVLTVMAQHGSGGVTSLTELPLAARFANASIACVKYIAKAIWPAHLALLYPLETPSIGLALLCLAGVAVITVTAFLGRKRHPYVLAGWFWYLGILVPVIGLVQVGDQSMADRYTYLPLVGLSIALIWTVADAVRGKPVLRMAGGTVAVAGLTLLASGSYHQISCWKTSETLYEHTLAVTTGNYVIANNLGVVLEQEHRPFEAMTQWENALSIHPGYALARANLGRELMNQGRLDEACAHLSEALKLEPDFLAAQVDLAAAEKLRGHYQEASRLLERPIHYVPNNQYWQNDYCFALQKSGRFDEAIAHCRAALTLDPRLLEAHFNLGGALASASHVDEAAAEFRWVLAAKPGDPAAGAALESLHRKP
jgi:protein O-mannosyl-transferase